MVRRLSFYVVLLAAASGCVSSDESGPEAGSVSTTAAESVAEASQQMVVATTLGDVVVYGDSLEETSRIAASESYSYRQPTWLDADSIVFAELPSTIGSSGLRAVDAESGSTEWRVELETFPFYFLPAPPGADAATTSLRNDPQGGLIAELVGDDGSVEQLSGDSPFYSSWSPDGESLAIHVRQSELSIRSGTDVITIADPSGVFQAPHWTDDGIVTLRSVEGGQLLSIWDDDAFVDVASIDGPVRFSASGGRIAIQSSEVFDGGGVEAGLRTQTLPTIPGGRLAVVDTASGSVITVSNQLVPMFQWSPNGQHLLYASFESDNSLEFRWHVWEDGSITDLSTFRAQPEWFRDVVPFFDQYIQSISLWSASSDRIAYPAVEDGEGVVVVEAIDGSGRASIPDAVWVSWSGAGAP